jgi:glycosyltransferase involved in cell wall biosynthesis
LIWHCEWRALSIEGAVPTLSIVIPHWPLDEETDEALGRSVASFPPQCERVIVVNDGTGYGRNVNIGLRLARADYLAVANNDCRLTEGDIYDLCVPETVTSPLVIGERQGLGESIEPGGFHGSFWVVPRPVLDRVGLLDERYEGAYWEDDDLLARLRQAGVPTRQVTSVRVKHVGGLTTFKVPEHRRWLELNAQRFEEKWGWLPPPIARFRRAKGSTTWHFCQNCPNWPVGDSEEAAPVSDYGLDKPPVSPNAEECEECISLRECRECAFY